MKTRNTLSRSLSNSRGNQRRNLVRSSKESISLKKATSIYLQQSNILPEREVEHLVATTSKNKEESQFFKSKEKIMRQSYQGSLREKMHKKN